MKILTLVFSLSIFYSCQTQGNSKELEILSKVEQEGPVYKKYANFNFLNNTGVGQYLPDLANYYELHNGDIYLTVNGTDRRIAFSLMDSSEYDNMHWQSAYEMNFMTTDESYASLFYSDTMYKFQGKIFIKDSLICFISNINYYSDHVVVFDNKLTPLFYINVFGYNESAETSFVAKFKNERPFILDSIRKPFKFIPNDINNLLLEYEDAIINQSDYTFSIPNGFPDFPLWVNFYNGYHMQTTDTYSDYHPE